MILPYIVLAILFATLAINLIASLKNYTKLRDYSKLLIIPLISLIIMMTRASSIFMVVGIISCFLGDVVLNQKGKYVLLIGGAFFLVSNISFSINFIVDSVISKINIPILIIALSISLISFIILIAILFKYVKGNNRLFAFIYLFFNFIIFITSIFKALTFLNFLTILGPLMYFISDYLLVLGRANEKARKITRYFVMPLYGVGILLLCLFI